MRMNDGHPIDELRGGHDVGYDDPREGRRRHRLERVDGRLCQQLIVPGGEHNAGRGGELDAYGERKRLDFFVPHLLGVSPPSWNDTTQTTETQTGLQE